MELLIFIIVYQSITYADLIIRPNNTNATIGTNVTLKCSTTRDKPVDWYFLPINRTEITIYSNGNINSNYRSTYNIIKIGRSYDLFIQNVKESLAGRYFCIDDEGLGPDTSSASLMVFPNPVLLTSTEYISFTSNLVDVTTEPSTSWYDYSLPSRISSTNYFQKVMIILAMILGGFIILLINVSIILRYKNYTYEEVNNMI